MKVEIEVVAVIVNPPDGAMVRGMPGFVAGGLQQIRAEACSV